MKPAPIKRDTTPRPELEKRRAELAEERKRRQRLQQEQVEASIRRTHLYHGVR